MNRLSNDQAIVQKDDDIDLFDESVSINIETDICAFCRQGQLAGIIMNNLLKYEDEIDDVDEDDDHLTTVTQTCRKDGYLNNIWLSPYSLRVNKTVTIRKFAHFYCALFGPLSWFDGTHWRNVRKEITRSQGLICRICKARGATLGCVEPRCRTVVHIPCAMSHGYIPGRANITNKYYCDEHQEKHAEEERQKILSTSNDLSRGKEPLSIEYNFTADHEDVFRDFEYITRNVDSNDVIASPQNLREWSCCECDGLCNDINTCACLAASRRHYTVHGILIPGSDDPILECNMKCTCSIRRCMNRVIGKGIQYRFSLLRKKLSGDMLWGVKTLDDIPAGAFVCEVVGQYILGSSKVAYHCKDGEVQNYRDASYAMMSRKSRKALTGRKNIFIVDAWHNPAYDDFSPIRIAADREQAALDMMDNSEYDPIPHYFEDPYPQPWKEESTAITPYMIDFLNQSVCLDCRYFGNIARFIRHRSSNEPKMLDRKIVYDNIHDQRYPRLALFAAMPIAAGTELVL